MDIQLQENLRCRLHLYSVLAAIPELLRLVPDARSSLGDSDFSLKFITRSGLRSTISFNSGNAIFHGNEVVLSDVSLYFFSDAHVNNLFTQTGFSAPLPIKGILRLWNLVRFKRISDLLQKYLKPDPDDLRNDEFRAIHVKILLGLVARAVCQLGQHEPASRELLRAGPDGMVAFSIGSEPEIAWVLSEKGRLCCGSGKPERLADVEINFKNSQLALDALNDDVDVNAEVGLGKIKVKGLLPLADTLGHLMQRIPLYLD